MTVNFKLYKETDIILNIKINYIYLDIYQKKIKNLILLIA